MLFSFIIEMIGALACAISGIRLAALRRFDWFGAYIVGLVTALGGGTLRDAAMGQPAFWVSDFRMFAAYFICTALALVLDGYAADHSQYTAYCKQNSCSDQTDFYKLIHNYTSSFLGNIL